MQPLVKVVKSTDKSNTRSRLLRKNFQLKYKMATEDFSKCLDIIIGTQDTIVFYMKMGNLDQTIDSGTKETQ